MFMGDPGKSLETGAQRPSRNTVVAGRTLSGALTNKLMSDVLALTCHLKIDTGAAASLSFPPPENSAYCEQYCRALLRLDQSAPVRSRSIRVPLAA